MLVLHPNSANAVLSRLISTADAGIGPAKLRFYGGVRPNPDVEPETGFLLEMLCEKPCGVIVENNIDLRLESVIASVNGIATFYRLVDHDGTTIVQGETSASFVAGVEVRANVSLKLLGDVPPIGYLNEPILVESEMQGEATSP